jgi:DNA-binding CsgD family transcriptional regulator
MIGNLDETTLSALIGAIYQAGADISLWPDVLRAISSVCDAHATVLTLQGEREGQSACLAPQCDPAYYQSYGLHYHSVDPIWPRSASAPAGTALTESMIMPKSEFIRTEFYNDFLIPQRLGSQLNAIAVVDDGRRCVIATHRRREFEPEYLRLFQLLSPHFQRALQINAKLASLESQSKASAAALNRLEQGVLLVDGRCRVMFANEEAERQFAAGGLRVIHGIVKTSSPTETARLNALVAQCAQSGGKTDTGGMLSLMREHGEVSITLHVIPLAFQIGSFFQANKLVAIVFMTGEGRKPKLAIAQIRRQFGLTAAEAALANEIVAGDGLQATADRLKITHATAHTHLARIFAKTGTQRQAGLVRLLLQRTHDNPLCQE